MARPPSIVWSNRSPHSDTQQQDPDSLRLPLCGKRQRWWSSAMQSYWHIVCVMLVPLSALAAEATTISTTLVDPGQACSVLASKLPKKLASLKTVGRLLRETATAINEYDCDQKQGGCRVHVLKFSGLELAVLVSGTSGSAWVMGATITSPKWRLLPNSYIGQTLENVEGNYGVTIPQDKSPVTLEGECTPLTVWHGNGHVTKLALDCQACY